MKMLSHQLERLLPDVKTNSSLSFKSLMYCAAKFLSVLSRILMWRKYCMMMTRRMTMSRTSIVHQDGQSLGTRKVQWSFLRKWLKSTTWHPLNFFSMYFRDYFWRIKIVLNKLVSPFIMTLIFLNQSSKWSCYYPDQRQDRRNSDCRKVSIKLDLGVAKEALFSDMTIGIYSLASAIWSCKIFAAKVLNAVLLERIVELFKRKTNSNSIFITNIPERLTEFLSYAAYLQALPGNETVIVGYDKILPKFLLKKRKLDLNLLFKKENPDVTFITRVLLRE